MNGKSSSRRARSQSTGEVPAEPRGRLLGSLEAIVLTRERLQEVLDDAVERGRMTRDDATELLAELIRRGRRQTDDLIGGARRATGLGAPFPIAGYDDLTAAHVNERLEALDAPELRRVRDHERRNANRKSVLAAIDRRLS
jgi:hypothetical protein